VEKILALCARNSGHELMYEQLKTALSLYPSDEHSWTRLIHKAEQHGVASLLYRHLRHIDFPVPVSGRRMLQSLYLRNRRSNKCRNNAVLEIVSACGREGIDVMLVKGIALCNSVYDEVALRPMRDVDLLIRKADIFRAEEILIDLGYSSVTDHAVPDDYYHLTPLEKIIDGLPVGIELHHNLLPFHPQYPLWPFEKSFQTSRQIMVDGTPVHTLSLEDTLYYAYLHGFQAPLTYEPYRLMHVADIVSLIEKYSKQLDWPGIRKESATLLTSIACFHFLTPLPSAVRRKADFDFSRKPWGVGRPFTGWPLRKIRDTDWRNMFDLLVETLLPPQWWLQLYYGCQQGADYWKARCLYHPRTIWRWIKVYSAACFKNRKPPATG